MTAEGSKPPRRRRGSGDGKGKSQGSAADRNFARRRRAGEPQPGARRSSEDSGAERRRQERAQPRRPRPDRAKRPERESPFEPVHIDDSITKELRNSARPGKGDILVKVFSEAVAAYAAGDLGEAIRLGEQAKHMALRSPNPREFLGLVYYGAERYQEAVKELAAFRRLTGLRIQNHVLADCYRALGKPEKALEYCDEVRFEDVGEEVYYEVQIVSAGALTDMGRVDEAIIVMQKLNLEPQAAEDHHVRAWYVLGDLLERTKKYTQAKKWFEAVAGADPEMTDAPERAARLTASG